MAGYVVTGPLAVVKIEGRRFTLDRGSAVPDGVDSDRIAHLVGVGLIGQVKSASKVKTESEDSAEK